MTVHRRPTEFTRDEEHKISVVANNGYRTYYGFTRAWCYSCGRPYEAGGYEAHRKEVGLERHRELEAARRAKGAPKRDR